ncbi:MAG: hypothetical protein L3J20_03780 [Flavobacteriaceae bacterium]|nr:hypothetical protein [Flavobacteriaceae bacterium]
MRITSTELLSMDFSLSKNEKHLPKNVYAIRVFNVDKKEFFEIAINHNGYCPQINSDYDESKINDYLSNLEYSLVEEYFKISKSKKPKSYYSVYEVMTNEKGDLYRYSKSTL